MEVSDCSPTQVDRVAELERQEGGNIEIEAGEGRETVLMALDAPSTQAARYPGRAFS